MKNVKLEKLLAIFPHFSLNIFDCTFQTKQ